MGIRVFTNELLTNAKRIFDESNGGKSISEVANFLGCNPTNLRKALGATGYIIPRFRKLVHNRKELPIDELVAKYASGASELALSKEYKCSRDVIRRHLIEGSADIRNGSQANFIRMSRLTVDERKQLAKAANDAVRGMPEPKSRKRKRAINTELGIAQYVVGHGEKQFSQRLDELGIQHIRQKAVDVYSLDFAINGVAVELKTGNCLRGVKADVARNKVKNLADLNWRCLYVVFETVEALIASAEQIIANVDILNGLPSPVSQYRVINCRFDVFTTLRDERGCFYCVATPPQLRTTVRDFDV